DHAMVTAHSRWQTADQLGFLTDDLLTDVRGVERQDDRRIISGIIHVLKSGCRWSDCPEAYGPPTTIYNRFARWARRGIWENLFRELAGNGRSADTQTIDSTHVKAHRSVAGGNGRSKSRLLAARAEDATRRYTHSLMLRGPDAILLTGGEAHDCPVAERLIRRVKPPKRMLGDKAYDRAELVENLIELVSAQRNRKLLTRRQRQ
ncbi:IS5 family transposase, partial [Bradyrhizobium sp. CCBAU 21362]|uniref:IS5 family transposase n=1 Tax=Bradyrhizobium sp. CCBAU 21362 TaxID=1325082 RepID=UPI0023065DA9